MKIYIVGTNGSGKTTLAKRLSEKLNIPHYELDRLFYENNYNNIKRENEVVIQLFNDIITKNIWIIEDLGREIFKEGFKTADLILFLDTSLETRIRRIDKRYENQKNGFQETSYIINDNLQERICKSSIDFEEKRLIYLDMLNQYSEKLLILNGDSINIDELIKKISTYNST